LKSERDFRNYLGGAALAFGIVLLSSEILHLVFGGVSEADAASLYPTILDIYLAVHVVGGFLGGYLVARVRHTGFIQTGIITAVIAFVFEFVYNIVVLQAVTDLYALVSLLIGCIIGAVVLRARIGGEKS